MHGKRVERKLRCISRRFSSLSHIPTLGSFPYVGSLWHLGRLKGDNGRMVSFGQVYEGHHILYKKYGAVYTLGIPSMGVGIRSLLVVCTDPREYMTVIRNEGRNPFGIVQSLWMMKNLARNNNWSSSPIFTQGDEWRRIRTAFQKALLSPSTVKGYLPGICKAAENASTAFQRYQDNLDTYTSYCSFDMFCCVTFGRLMNTSTGEVDDENQKFCTVTMDALRELTPLSFSFREIIFNMLGYRTSRINLFNKNMIASFKYGTQLVDDFVERRDRGELNEFETNSYIAANLQKTQKDGLTAQEFKEMTTLLLVASVDTTSGIINWLLIYLALYRDVQTKVRREILSHMKIDGGSSDLANTLAMGANQAFPYLSAVIREVHRLRPAVTGPIIKAPIQDIELGGYLIPKGTPCMLELFSIQNDPSIVKNCNEFLPERWLPVAVAARKGTTEEVLDHPLLRDPFSAGSRKCPGSRVARQEVLVLVATLVRKYSFTLAPNQGINNISDIPYFRGTVVQPTPMPKFIVEKLPTYRE